MRLASTLLLALSFACRYPNADALLDADEDGVTADVDCDDSDGDVGASITFHTDDDGDGVGTDDGATEEGCTAPDGFGVGTDDCDDADDERFPGNDEVTGDGVDQDCSGTDAVDCFVDADKDGWGSATTIVAADGSCDEADGEAGNDDDCADGDDERFPGADEIVGDGIDQNCDGLDTAPCYTDGDDDGFGDPLAPIASNDCTGANQSENGDDCDDTHATVSPGATESCEGLPSDCDDWTGPTTPGAPPLTEVDDDDDAFVECTFAPGVTPANWGNEETIPVAGGDDCDDTHTTVRPGATEACDGFPSDCDDWTDATTPGSRPPDEVDDDNDGYVECTFASGITATNWGNDEAPSVAGGGDCNDVAASSGAVQYPTNPTARCDGLDNDCVGGPEEDDVDDDNDTFVDCTFASGVNATNWPNNETPDVAGDRDCDDTLARTFFGAPEFCDDMDNDCDNVGDATDTDSHLKISRESGGTWTNVTPANVLIRNDLTQTTAGTNWLCPGTHYVRFNLDAPTSSVRGRYGRDVTTLSGRTPGTNARTDRMIDVDHATAVVTIEGLEIEGGFETGGMGGAIRVEASSTVAITDCDVRDNFAQFGGGLWSDSGTITVTNVSFTDNEADESGGAIFLQAGTLNVNDSFVGGQLDSNDADIGAGLAVNSGNVTLTNTDFTSNRATAGPLSGNALVLAAVGGGILFGGGGNLTINGGTFFDNSVVTEITGGDNSTASASGGAIYFGSGILDIDGTTFESNFTLAKALDNNNPTTANSRGGAIHVLGGTVHLDDVTFEDNDAQALSYDSDTNPPNVILNPDGRGGALYVAAGTVTGGAVSPVTFTANRAENYGGAIFLDNGTVALTGSLLELNFSDGGGSEGGGAMAMREGTLTLNTTDVVDNDAVNNDGGGLLVLDSTTNTPEITLSSSDFTGNEAADWGGAIACYGNCTITATNSFLSNNIATEGGAVMLDGATSFFECISTPANQGGMLGNSATDATSGTTVSVGDAVQINTSGAKLKSTGCDFGATAAPQAVDIGFDNGTKNYAANATFDSCLYTGCP